VFATFLTWMQEKSAPVFTVATANDIQSLPPETLRKGRFDEIFFVDLPNAAERQEIWAIHLRKRNRPLDRFNLTRLAEETEGFSGAEIEQAILSAMYDAFDEEREVEMPDLLRNIHQTIPLSQTMRDQVEMLRGWGRQHGRLATGVREEI
jgi:SpoVK/Ycf46/Vps4 family AAA+-type ATPase